jgi:MFS family permease
VQARRNFVLGVVNGALFQLADTLSDPTLVIVAVVAHLSASPLLIGLVVPLRFIVWYLPQLWVSGFVQSWPRKLPLYRSMALVRGLLWIGLVAGVFWLDSRAGLLAMFLVALPLIDLLGGISAVSFMTIVAKVIPPRERSAFFAWRLTIGGAMAVAGGLLVRAVLGAGSPLAFPDNFGLVIGLTAIMAVLGMLTFGLTVEPKDEQPPPPASLPAQLRNAQAALATDADFRRFIQMRSLLALAGAATPFYAVYARETFGVPTDYIGLYLAAYTGTALAANILYARISRRLGHRRSMALVSLGGIAMVTLVLLVALLARPLGLTSNQVGLVFVLVFVFSGLRESGIGVVGNSLLLDIAPAGRGPLYVGVAHSVLGLVLLLTAGSGLLVGGLGYLALFGLAALTHLAALWEALRMREAASADHSLSRASTERGKRTMARVPRRPDLS